MKSLKIFLFLFFFSTVCQAQSINCPNNSVYIHTGPQILEQPIPLPASSTTVMTGLPAGASGLAVGPSLGFPAPDPTFWTVSGGTYWYYNGLTWINTNHATGNLAALNIGGGRNRLYNLVGGTGQIYTYDGTGNGTLLTTISAFGGNGPYDISADANNNFYLVKATAPNPSLLIFDAGGNQICSYALANLPQVTGGGGFAIVNNVLAVYNNAFCLGTINSGAGQITFTLQPAITNPSDFANCVLSVPTGSVLAPSGATLDCLFNPIPLIAQVVPGGIGMDPGPASSTLNSCPYLWSGPGIVSGQGTASISVNQPGVYSYTVCSSGCPAQQVVKSFTVFNGPSLTPTITAPTCYHGPCVLSLSCNAASNISWSGPAISGPSNTSTLSIVAPGVYSAVVSNSLGCSSSQSVNVFASPNIMAALSSNTICAKSSNGSNASLTLTPAGATAYTLLAGSNYVYTGTAPWICTPVGATQPLIASASATVIGSNGVCSGSTIAVFSIIPNPSIAVTPSAASVCSGLSKTITVSGATGYNWLASPSLNTLTGPIVVATSLNATNVYSVYGSSQGCNSASQSATLLVLPLPSVYVNPPSTTVCAGSQLNLQAGGSAASYTWNTSANPSSAMGINMSLSLVANTVFTVTGSLNSCTSSATASVATVPPPQVAMLLNDYTVCAQAINGSPAAVTVTPFGAMNYTLLTGTNFNVSSQNGPGMTILPNGLSQPLITQATATLLGSNGYCTVSATQTFSIFPNPVITSVPAQVTVCPGDGQLLNVSGANNYSWLQSTPGLSDYNSSIVMANPTVTSVYSVIGESLGCMSMAQINIVNISPLPTVAIVASSPTLCYGSAVNLTATGNASSYNWLAAPGMNASTGANATANPLSAQTYTVVGALNNCMSTAEISLTVVPSPSLNVSASAYTMCSGSNVHLYVSGANSYNWQPATGPNSTVGQHIVSAPLSNTTFTVRGANGVCTGSATVFVRIIQNPDLKLEAAADQLCAGGSVLMKASGAQQFKWSPATNLSSLNDAVVIASPPVSTNYLLTGINSDGSVSCVSQVSYFVSVLPPAKAIVGSEINICEGGSAVLTVSGANDYLWKPGNNLNKAFGNKVLAQPKVSTIYTVEASYNGDCSVTNTIAVKVHAEPTVSAGRDSTYNVDDMIMISASGTGTLKWIGGEQIACSDCPNTRVSPKINNCYRVEATSEFGCKASDDVCITLTDNFYVYIPNSFTPNHDGLNDLFLISGTGISHVTMDIYDRWGAQIFSSKDQASGWDGSFKGVECKPGVYTYQISYKGMNGKNYSKTSSVTLLRE